MKNIKNFRIDQNLDSHDNIGKIQEKVDELASQQEILNLCSKLSELVEVPSEVLNMKVKQIIYNKFNYLSKTPRFKLNFNLFHTIKYSIFFIIFALVIKKLKFEKINVDIILDNVEKNMS